MTPRGPHWFAGPVGYRSSTTFNTDFGLRIDIVRFDFVACDANGKFGRYVLTYDVRERTFSHHRPTPDYYEEQKGEQLLDFYRPMAIANVDLKKRSRIGQLKAMLSQEQMAELLALSIQQRDLFT